MSYDGVAIVMRGGEGHVVRGIASQISQTINEARGKGQLIELERCTIPTGEKIWVDPDEVTSIKAAR